MRRAAASAATAPSSVHTPSGATATADGDVIAIHDARGRLLLSFDAATGALELSAAEGDLVLRAPRGRVVVAGQVVELAAGAIEVRASRVLERVVDVYREIEGTLHTSAGVVRTLVRGSLDLFAKDTRIVSEEDTAIDGKHVLLG